jgi:hypothetical protein
MEVGVSVLLYTGRSRKLGGRLEKMIGDQVPGQEIERCRDVKGLSRRFRRPVHDVDVVVLLLSSRDDLDAMLGLQDVLRRLQVILILPDEWEGTLSMAHKLFPRFITFVDRGFLDVAAVLKRMLENARLSGRLGWR